MTVSTSTTLRISTAVIAAGLMGALVGCTDTAPVDEPSSPSVTNPSNEPEASDAPQEGVGMEEASRIATEKYGGTVSSIEDDSYKGEPAWEVEIKDSSEGRIEVKVSKATGDILNMEQD